MEGGVLHTALIQLGVGQDRSENLTNAADLITEATNAGAKLVILPEYFNSSCDTSLFSKYAESIPDGPTCEMLSKAAKDNSIYLVGGTFPERGSSTIYNTCTVWNPEGQLIAKFRKIHLFDADIPGKITFTESAVITPGNELTVFNIEDIKIGLGICHDLRFEEMAKLYRLQGCKLLIYPGAFNMTTGPLHWELLQRARATDNQLYVLGVSPARSAKGYIAWGHTQVTNPWGKVIASAGHQQEILYCNIDFAECDNVRQQIPIYQQRRVDIYDTICYKH